MLRFSFDPGTYVFEFCYVFWYHSDSVTNGTKNGFIAMEGPRDALFLWVREWDHFVCCCLIK